MSGTIALPKGSHIQKDLEKVLALCDVTVLRSHPREIRCAMRGMGTISEAIFCRHEQVIDLLVSGKVDFGIVGSDLLFERDPDDLSITVAVLGTLPYAKSVRMVVFTRSDNPVHSIDDLVASAKLQRVAPVIASEYPNQTRMFFEPHGLLPQIIPCKSAEMYLCLDEQISYGVALVETGTTLAVNGLKELEDETLSQSSLVLIGRRDGDYELMYTVTRWLMDLCCPNGAIGLAH